MDGEQPGLEAALIYDASATHNSCYTIGLAPQQIFKNETCISVFPEYSGLKIEINMKETENYMICEI